MMINWNYIVATDPIRGGAYDKSTFLISYWYPQIAVYDDIAGWDKTNYTGNHEFYNDFNNYDVNIHLPQGFTVWATGLLQNPEQVLPQEQLKKYRQAMKSDEIIPIITKDDYSFNSLNVNSLAL